MNTEKLNAELLAVGAKLKAKGWNGGFVNIFIQYLAIFDREPLEGVDPMISYQPNIRLTAKRANGSFVGNGSAQEYVRDIWDIKTLEEAIAKLHQTADAIPTMIEEAARIDVAKNKLTESERRLLGVR